MRRNNLVIARVGRSSLHPSWLAPVDERNWDLYLCPYQKLQPQGDLDCTVGEVLPGPKWTGLRELLNSWNGWREYERIWLPDDDIFASKSTINRMFSLARGLSFDLCAPALQEASYYAHYSTMRNQSCFARRTGFVEIMVPCFSASVLERLLWTLDLSPSGWGWGLDSLWPKLLDYRNVGIIDAAAVLHTRPVGMFRDAELGRRVHAESDHIMEAYGCSQIHKTFAAVGPDLQNCDLKPTALAAVLADGWRYLFATNPAVLPLMLQAQQPESGWGVYPVAGTPSCAVQ